MIPAADDIVLLVCADELKSRHYLEHLLGRGLSVVGPASSAANALALAAQTAPTLALVASEPTGRRKSIELAQELMNHWGIRSVVTHEACPGAAAPSETVYWAADPAQQRRLEPILSAQQRA